MLNSKVSFCKPNRKHVLNNACELCFSETCFLSCVFLSLCKSFFSGLYQIDRRLVRRLHFGWDAQQSTTLPGQALLGSIEFDPVRRWIAVSRGLAGKCFKWFLAKNNQSNTNLLFSVHHQREGPFLPDVFASEAAPTMATSLSECGATCSGSSWQDAHF